MLALAIAVAQAFAAYHLIIRRRDVRSAAGWMGLIWLAPVIGVILYALFGINRIQRRARTARPVRADYRSWIPDPGEQDETLRSHLGDSWRHLVRLAPLGDRVTCRPLLAGCAIEPLVDGEETYPAMLQAIDEAERSITFLSFIFDADRVGRMFAEALGRAVKRGVEVRVLIDAMGARYSVPRMSGHLKRMDVRVAHFMPGFIPWRTPYVNLRNHRKIMVVDGRVAFTGGMNIRAEFWPESPDDQAARDLHFRVEGPVVCEVQEAFAEDWTFTTGERLEGDRWFPSLEPVGSSMARGISDGPDIDFENIQLMLMGALSVARSSVRILTPYFLPDQQLVSALNICAMRGVQVEVIIPGKNNQKLVQWACNAQLDQMLERGVRVFASPEPFDHSKLMLVDACWVLFGSANWDPRSLQLNFEFNVEAYDPKVAARLGELFKERREASREITLEEMASRPVPVKVRDGLARLFSPYL
ncbi:MAG: cardiolipin synthase [Gemmatimonadetes bacterium]|nr:cardiolipin synthase [Gemmatimonadota bacterium]